MPTESSTTKATARVLPGPKPVLTSGPGPRSPSPYGLLARDAQARRGYRLEPFLVYLAVAALASSVGARPDPLECRRDLDVLVTKLLDERQLLGSLHGGLR